MVICGHMIREDHHEYFDLQGFIDSEVARGKKDIVIPGNHKYRIKPQNKQHLFLEGLEEISFSFRNVEMICTETTRAITLLNCKNVTIRGLTIDYDPLPYTQGKIIGFGRDDDQKLVHEIELFDGFLSKTYVDGTKYEIFNPSGRNLRYGNYFGVTVEKKFIDPKRINVKLPRKYDDIPNFKRTEQIGDIIAIGCTYAPHGKIPHAICAIGCSRLRMEDVTLYASNNFGFFERNCDASVYLRCKVDRRSPETDPIPREDSRIRSLNADAYHSKHAKIGPSIVDCTAKFNGDDSVNICGDYHFITSAKWVATEKCNCLELRVLGKNTRDNDSGGINIWIGDRVELTTYSGERLRYSPVVVSVLPDGKITDKELRFLNDQNIDKGIKTNGLKRAFRIQLRAEVAATSTTTTVCNTLLHFKDFHEEKLGRGSVIASLNRVGNGFLIKGCDFGYNRSRGILVKGSNGIITRNTLSGNWGEAIRVAPGYWWLESGSSNEIQIRGNTIRDCRSYGIAVYSLGGDSSVSHNFAPSGAHSNVSVTHNILIRCPLPNLLLTSTDGFEISNNDFEESLVSTVADGPANVKRILDRMEAKETMLLNCKNEFASGTKE